MRVIREPNSHAVVEILNDALGEILSAAQLTEMIESREELELLQ